MNWLLFGGVFLSLLCAAVARDAMKRRVYYSALYYSLVTIVLMLLTVMAVMVKTIKAAAGVP